MAVSIPATRVTRFIDQLIDVYGQPTAIRCEFWRYNEIRPHDALGSLPPARYREKLLAAMSTLKLSTSRGSLHALPYYFIVPQANTSLVRGEAHLESRTGACSWLAALKFP